MSASRITLNGRQYDFDAAVNLMDEELRERLNGATEDGTTDQQFFDAYCRAHAEKFGEDFEVG